MGAFSKVVDKVKATLFPPEAKPGDPPAWVGRLKPAKYVSLSGVSFDFLYLDLSTYIPIKSASFGNVDGDGAYIQHNGIGGLRFPMLMVFTDGNNDLHAQTAISALVERGDATLYHPVYGVVNVVPTGELEQVNAFVTEANQTSIIVELLETTGILIDNLQPYDSALSNYLDNAAKSFLDTVKLEDVAEEISFANKVKSSIGKVKKTVKALSNGVAKSQAAIDDTFDSINYAIDTLVKDPLMLARQIQNLIMTPAYELGMIKAKMQAYANLARDIFGGNDSKSSKTPNTYDNTQRNEFAVNALIAATATAAMTQSTQKQKSDKSFIPLKKDLVKLHDELALSADELIEWMDESATNLSIQNNSGDWQDIADITAISIRDLISQITVARTEIKITTTYDRATAAWCFELTGSIHNDSLWRFQQSNNLGGDELLVIKPGRELVYYA